MTNPYTTFDNNSDRSAESLCGFVESTVAPGSLIVTDDWSGYAGLGKRGYEHFAVAECGDPEVAEQYLPIIHLVFANLKTWLIGIHHGVSHQHLQACQRRSQSTPLAGVKKHHLMRFSPALAVVPVVHRRDPRCFV